MLVWTIPANFDVAGTQLALVAFGILWLRVVLRRILEYFGRPISWALGTCQRGNALQCLVIYCLGLGVYDAIFRAPRDQLFHFYIIGFAVFATYLTFWWLTKDHNLSKIGFVSSKGPLILEFEGKGSPTSTDHALLLLRFMNGLVESEPDFQSAFLKLMKRLETLYPEVRIQLGKGGGPYEGYPHPLKHTLEGISLDVTLYFAKNTTTETIEVLSSTVYFLFIHLVRQYVH